MLSTPIPGSCFKTEMRQLPPKQGRAAIWQAVICPTPWDFQVKTQPLWLATSSKETNFPFTLCSFCKRCEHAKHTERFSLSADGCVDSPDCSFWKRRTPFCASSSCWIPHAHPSALRPSCRSLLSLQTRTAVAALYIFLHDMDWGYWQELLQDR